LKRLRASEFLRNTAVLSSGTIIAQGISVLTAPILTRIYLPEDYGLLGIYMVFCSLTVTISTLQYHNAIITADSDDNARDAFHLCVLINMVSCLLLTLAVVFFGAAIASLYKSESIIRWIIFAPVSTFFVSLNTTFSAWAIRKKKFKLLSYNRILTAILAPLFSISLGVWALGPIGLFVGLFVSQIVPTVRMSMQLLGNDQLNLNFQFKRVRSAAKSFKNYPVFSLPSDFINNLSNQFPLMMLSRVGGVQVVGWYNLSARMLGLPTTIISMSIAEVFRQRAASDYALYGNCRPIFNKVFKTLLLIALPIFLLLCLFGPQLFHFVFGQRWEQAGVVTQILAILYLFKFVVSPLSYVTFVANKQWVSLLIDCLLLIFLFTVYLIAINYHLDYKSALLIFSLAYSSLYFLTFYLSYKFTVNDRIPQKAI
jgi:O-antigen/teichoic acid export membrane protein